jgi:hypothetical protein
MYIYIYIHRTWSPGSISVVQVPMHYIMPCHIISSLYDSILSLHVLYRIIYVVLCCAASPRIRADPRNHRRAAGAMIPGTIQIFLVYHLSLIFLLYLLSLTSVVLQCNICNIYVVLQCCICSIYVVLQCSICNLYVVLQRNFLCWVASQRAVLLWSLTNSTSERVDPSMYIYIYTYIYIYML